MERCMMLPSMLCFPIATKYSEFWKYSFLHKILFLYCEKGACYSVLAVSLKVFPHIAAEITLKTYLLKELP
jgi:hypothetical protein